MKHSKIVTQYLRLELGINNYYASNSKQKILSNHRLKYEVFSFDKTLILIELIRMLITDTK